VNTKLIVPFAAAAMATLFVPSALAAGDADLRAIREEIEELKAIYEKRISDLERRLQQAEAAAGKAEAAAGRAEAGAASAEATAQSAAIQASSRPASENAFNPALSLILNGVYTNLSRDPAHYQLTGFVPTLGEVSPGVRGLSLGESELAVSANVDHTLRGNLFASITPENTIGVEEAYVQSIGLSNGFTFKAGRFFSGVGYLNELHAHAWDFTDAPLASKVFLGNQFADDGVQLKWVAPTETYFDVGAEIGRGRSFPGSNPDKNGAGSSTLFAHLGGDVGTGGAWRLGASLLSTAPRNRAYDDVDALGTAVTNSFSGTSRLAVVDGVLKWAPNGNATEHNFKLQGEYFRRVEDGTLTYDTAGASLGTLSDRYRSAQSGWYLQSVYQFMPRWRAGYRYDRLNAGTVSNGLIESGALAAADFPSLMSYNPTRNTLMLDFSPSEFSRFRLQFAQDKSRLGLTDNQVFLQYIVSLGAHGAHKF
jgi:hypothetical protein